MNRLEIVNNISTNIERERIKLGICLLYTSYLYPAAYSLNPANCPDSFLSIYRSLVFSIYTPLKGAAKQATPLVSKYIMPVSYTHLFSPAILYILGIISKSPCEAVNVVVSAPAARDP